MLTASRSVGASFVASCWLQPLAVAHNSGSRGVGEYRRICDRRGERCGGDRIGKRTRRPSLMAMTNNAPNLFELMTDRPPLDTTVITNNCSGE